MPISLLPAPRIFRPFYGPYHITHMHITRMCDDKKVLEIADSRRKQKENVFKFLLATVSCPKVQNVSRINAI